MSQEQVQSTGKVIKLSDILSLMEQGKSRKEINDLYGETDAAMKAKVWSHPKLKNKKSAKVVNITLEDDTVTETFMETGAVLETANVPIPPALEETVTIDDQVVDEAATEQLEPAQDSQSSAPGTW